MINKNIEHWVKNYNLMGPISGFGQLHYKEINQIFSGDLTMIIYDRKIKEKIFKIIDIDYCLDGWLPSSTDEFLDEDFVIIPSAVYSFSILTKLFKKLNNDVVMFNVNIDNINNRSQVKIKEFV
jgi:hypothetical protein